MNWVILAKNSSYEPNSDSRDAPSCMVFLVISPVEIKHDNWISPINGGLVGGLEPWNFMTFHIHLGMNVIIPTDELTP